MNAKELNAHGLPIRRCQKRGFTLIEMVVVVLILGIVAAVAVPKMFNTADTAGENATHQQLALLRTALEIYRSENNTYPPGVDLPAELGPYLRGPFPIPQVGSVRNQAGVAIDADADPDVAAAPSGSDGSDGNGWVYKPANGDIILNLTTGTGSDW
ncbi:type II secretion system protein [Candidatus Laterigemmans baculatus]|uniref:type II secretion system protein n=1 Tax=Candidatus Laterigemmans baculatus TaxID=2770505 RepID=UPI0013DC1B8F|nr:prepilin-type N-terminal cleavage/methylation domain-containing protein [Candidatus Laterigemmans baculatus]